MHMPLQLGSKPLFTGSPLEEVGFVSLDFSTHPESSLQKLHDNLFIVPPFLFLQYTLQMS